MSFFSKLFRRAPGYTGAHAAADIANRPMMMLPGALDLMIASGSNHAKAPVDGEFDAAMCGKPEDLIEIESGVGVLSIRGPLFQRFGIAAWWYGGMGYDVIGKAFDMLMMNGEVQRIVLDIDSPGGMVSGCFELHAKIFAARGIKPIDAVANDTAFSAAYAIACAADRVHLPNTGGVGSVGVIATHVDISRFNDKLGVTYTSVISGEKKADYSPNAPLSDRARTDLQAEVDRLADAFINAVAIARGIAPEAVRALQAGCYFGPGAIAAGLADAIDTLEDVAGDAHSADGVGDGGEDPALPVAPPADGASASVAPPVIAANSTPATDPTIAAQVNRAIVADCLAAAKLDPDAGMALLTDSAITPETIDARITHARSVIDLCAAAGIRSVATDYITKHTDIESVRSQLIAAKAEGEVEITTAHPQTSKGAANALDPFGIYETRRRSVAADNGA